MKKATCNDKTTYSSSVFDGDRTYILGKFHDMADNHCDFCLGVGHVVGGQCPLMSSIKNALEGESFANTLFAQFELSQGADNANKLNYQIKVNEGIQKRLVKYNQKIAEAKDSSQIESGQNEVDKTDEQTTGTQSISKSVLKKH